MDAGLMDAGLMDAGLMDAGLMDAGLMDVAAALCVAAAAVHLLLVRDRSSRAGHAVMLAAMVALAFGMDRWPVLVACVMALAAVGGRMLLSAHGSSRACALDALGCAALVAVAALTTPYGGDAMSGMPGMSHPSHEPSTTAAILLVALVGGAGWAVLGRLVDRSRARVGQLASGLMIGGMALMALH